MTEAKRIAALVDEATADGQRTAQNTVRIRKLLTERHDATLKFMRAVRNFQMSVRGSTVLHVVKPGSAGNDVTPMIQEALTHDNRDLNPEIVTASTVEEARVVIETKTQEIRIAVIEANIDYPGDGILFAKWVKEEYPRLPMLLATDREEDVDVISTEIPYVDVFLAKSMSTTQLMRIFGCVIKQD